MNLLREEYCKEINTPMGLDDVYDYVKWLEKKLTETNQTLQLPQTAAICCGNLEKMNINWMVLEDGTKIMPFIEDKKDNTKWRVNNCPSCGAYVRDCTFQQ